MSQICTSSINIFNSTFGSDTCGDIGIDLNTNLTTPLSEVTTVEEFERIIYSELIDVKTRQTIQAYPVLRLLYERYLNNNSCNISSNGYNYDSMQNISQLVGNYWVDLIEQFVPSTTIWGSTFVYRNTVFDTQKYAYKRNSLFLCEDPSPNFPFSAISSDCNVDVIKIKSTSDTPPQSGSTPFDSENFFSCEQHENCECVWTMTNNCDSEFIGRVIEDSEFEQYCEDNLLINEVQLNMSLTIAPGCNALNQTWDSTSRIYTQILKISDNESIPVTTEYNYTVIPYGNNSLGITMTVTKLNTSTIQIDWDIPLSAPEPLATDCPGFYNNIYFTFFPFQVVQLWGVRPLVIVTEPDFNCEITRLFINYN
jgi:hypothetical protein